MSRFTHLHKRARITLSKSLHETETNDGFSEVKTSFHETPDNQTHEWRHLQVDRAHRLRTPPKSDLICFVAQVLEKQLQSFSCTKQPTLQINYTTTSSTSRPTYKLINPSPATCTCCYHRDLECSLDLMTCQSQSLGPCITAGNIMYSSDNLPPLPTDFISSPLWIQITNGHNALQILPHVEKSNVAAARSTSFNHHAEHPSKHQLKRVSRSTTEWKARLPKRETRLRGTYRLTLVSP